MIPIRKAAARFLSDLLAEYTTKEAKNNQTIESIDERLAAYVSRAPKKRTAADEIRDLIAGGTIIDPVVLAELETDAIKLDADADRYDRWAADLRPTLANSISFGQAFDAVLPPLYEINAVPESLAGFTATVIPGTPPTYTRPLTATTSDESTNHFVTLWRTPWQVAFDLDDAVHVETRAAAPSTSYVFNDAGAPAGTWSYWATPLNEFGMPGSTSGPFKVTVT